jgi:hypothetical protein
MRTQEDMTMREAREHLDAGNHFHLNHEGRTSYVARKERDGSYLVYSPDQNARYEKVFERALPMGGLAAWVHVPSGDAVESAITGGNEVQTLEDFSPPGIRAALESGESFELLSAGEEGWKMARTADGAYVVYNVYRATFDECVQDMAKYGPAWRWVAEDGSGEVAL